MQLHFLGLAMTEPMLKLLIVDDNEAIRTQMRWAFSKDYEVLTAENRKSAIEIVKNNSPGVIILDLGLPPAPGDTSEGFKAIYEIREIDPVIKILIVTGNKEKDNALKAIEMGAFDFFTKPVVLDEVRITVKRAFHVAGLERENIALHKGLDHDAISNMLGTSEPINKIFEMIRKVATVDVPVLITGESGTGKELAAAAIHRLSNRREGPFVVINCGAIPETLLESELFGHEKGAFTGADTSRKGKIEYADGGSLFLDEVGELSLQLQVKLLRFFQEHTIERIGGRELKHIDVRIIAATNRDIKALVRENKFRDDLYYRLGVITIEMPPLRERGDDIYILALAFLRKYSKTFNRKIHGFSDDAIEAIRDYRWPGNIRELENRIKRAIAVGHKEAITPEELALPLSDSTEKLGKISKIKGFIAAKETFEKRMIQEALLRHKGVINRAAVELGISRQYLGKLVLKYDLKLS